MNFKAKSLFGALATLAIASTVNAANVPIGDGSSRFLITTSQTWTANNVYNLRGQIYVAPGATLTIEAGTVIKSNPADMGSLAICRGAKIIANGTPTKPIIFTSTNDNLTTLRHAIGEWGNITIMGRALISASHSNATPLGVDNPVQTYQEGSTETPPFGTITSHTNTGSPDGLNKNVMEGLVSEGTGDPRVLYGGADDNDDSGSLSYVSLRFGGTVVGLNNELNGLSVGGVGRETDLHHIDIWDSLDDGIETWGGTVNYKYISVWQAGDDSFDVDEGWRGKAQFGLLVQGYGAKVAQGSGSSDNIFEIDGAERNDAQPVTTATIYNFTCIGNAPTGHEAAGSDQGIALRDEAKVQFRNCIFMDVGECLIKEEASETSDPNHTETWRYRLTGPANAWNNTLPSWDECWTTSYDAAWNKSHALNAEFTNQPNVASYSQAFLQNMYQAQTDGYMMELSDSLLYHNVDAVAGKEAYANTRGYNYVAALNGGVNGIHDNVIDDGTGTFPLRAAITREAAQNFGGLWMANVTSIDPRANPACTAITSVKSAPADGFFTPAPFRGAFSTNVNWALGWTAASAYGVMSAANTASNPPAAGVTLVSSTQFQTVSGVIYTVESSTDGKVWKPIRTVVGDNTVMTISEASTDSGKAYRAIAQ